MHDRNYKIKTHDKGRERAHLTSMELPLSQDLVDKVHSDAAKVLTQRTNGAATIHVTILLTKPWKWMQNKNPSVESSCQF